MPMANMAAVVSYPGPPASCSTAIVPAGQMLQTLPPLQRGITTYGAHTAPNHYGYPGVNSGVARRQMLRQKYGQGPIRPRRMAPKPPGTITTLPEVRQQTDDRPEQRAITYVPEVIEPIKREQPIVPIGKARSLANLYSGGFINHGFEQGSFPSLDGRTRSAIFNLYQKKKRQ